MPVLHADQLPLSREIGFNCREAGEALLLTDALVAAANTVQGLVDAVNNVVLHAEFNAYKSRVIAAIRRGEDSAEITDALVAPLTTVTGLVNLTQAVNYTPNRALYLD